jgi:sugar phosphate isomerase/epimerase
MKYANNHEQFFRSPVIAFLCGMVQATMVIAVEIANILVLLAAPDVIEVILNFIAIAIIAEFDDFIFKNIRDENKLKKILNDDHAAKYLLEIYHTTSARADPNEQIETPVII